jgi:hypothetical protein
MAHQLLAGRWFWMGAGLLSIGLLFGILGFVYEDPRFEESGVVQDLRANTWMMMNSGGMSGYVDIRAMDTGAQRRWTLPLRTAMQYKDRLLAMQGKYVKVIVAGAQSKEIMQLVHQGEMVIPLEESLKYKAQGRAWFGWGGLILVLAGGLLWVLQWLAVRKAVLSVRAEST